MIDTNAFVSALSRKSKHHLVVDALRKKVYDLFITTEILLDYEEKIMQKYDAETAELFLRGLVESPNVFQREIFFNWHLIVQDEDDNKFVDCAILGNADYLVSDDRHIRALTQSNYPKLTIVTLQEFYDVLLSKNSESSNI